jgi:hypothetical protein
MEDGSRLILALRIRRMFGGIAHTQPASGRWERLSRREKELFPGGVGKDFLK